MRRQAGGLVVDRSEGKLLGVCAAIANRTGLDVTIVRVAVVLAALIGSFFWVAILYFGAGLIGSQRHRIGGRTRRRAPDREESRERMRSLDLRMQAIETYVTSSNSRLAREIEELR